MCSKRSLLLADIFENFRNKSIEIYKLDPAYFLSTPALKWQACLKKTEAKLELLTDTNMLLMIEDRIRGGITYATHRYAEANNKYMKNYDKSKESSYLMYLDANNLYGWGMSQKLPVDSFKCVKNVSMVDEKFIKDYCKDSNIGYILEVDTEYPKHLQDLHRDLPFLPERMKIDKCSKLVRTLYHKKDFKTSIKPWIRFLKSA